MAPVNLYGSLVHDETNLRLLYLIGREGSISRAAQSCGISQPSASARLSRMEKSAGLSLVQRTPRGSWLTPQGEELAASAHKVLIAIEGFKEALLEQQRSSAASLRIAASYTIAEYLVEDWLESAGLHAPSVSISLLVDNSESVRNLVLNSTVDIGFIEGDYRSEDLDDIAVGGDELALIVGSSHPWANRSEISPFELVDLPLIMREPGSGTREQALNAIWPVIGNDSLTISREIGSTSAIKRSLKGERDATFLSLITVKDELDDATLVRIPIAGLTIRRTFRAIIPRGLAPTGPIALLLDAAQQAN